MKKKIDKKIPILYTITFHTCFSFTQFIKKNYWTLSTHCTYYPLSFIFSAGKLINYTTEENEEKERVREREKKKKKRERQRERERVHPGRVALRSKAIRQNNVTENEKNSKT